MKKEEIFDYIVDHMSATYRAKNSDYGDSVGDTYNKFGDISFLVRISDKYNRLVSLTNNEQNQQVQDEKLEDTILDMANYCILWLIERQLKNK